MKLEVISKLDAARRQLLAALHIHWYLNEPIAVYTLAANSWEVCNSLLKKDEKIRILQQITEAYGAPPKEIIDLINAPRNFVKHADRDPDAVFPDIKEEDCDAVLLTACLDYMFANGRSPYIMGIFLSWYSAIYQKKVGVFMEETAQLLFPELAFLNREQQKKAARKVLSNPTPPLIFHDHRTELTDNHRWVHFKKVFNSEV
ncbi:hypothetical protein [Falsochrobactrum ovis]|uniref:hypothetical protein n=1 Tax=Falsochrobactrum ovis TaxID=1293442 RepID=UPI001AEC9771|nr:hypothetical protein [Falsochrobactrum ovis]